MKKSVSGNSFQRGFSLVEMMIVLGLAGVASLVVVQIHQNSNKLQNTVSQRSDFDSLVNQVELLVSTQCDLNFKDKTLSPEGILSIASLKQAAPGGPPIEVISVGGEINGIEVDSLVLSLSPALIPATGEANVLGEILITALKDRGSTKRNTLSSQTMVKKLPISIRIDSLRVVKGCGNSTSGIPSGAVLAFNLASCPTGWIVSDGTSGTVDLGGKNIVGISPTKLLGSSAGEENHLLRVNELAPHNHQYDDVTPTNKETDAKAGDNDTNVGSFKTIERTTGIGPSGAQVPFNVMDPYVALLYCQKI
jgi:prepilin-type N-terminal cleavage/methylation domain-containing protein